MFPNLTKGQESNGLLSSSLQHDVETRKNRSARIKRSGNGFRRKQDPSHMQKPQISNKAVQTEMSLQTKFKSLNKLKDPNYQNELANQIKEIEKRLKECKRQLVAEKKAKLAAANGQHPTGPQTLTDYYPQEQDPEPLKRRHSGSMPSAEPKGFDYLTNPNPKQNEPEEPTAPAPFDIKEGLAKLERIYEGKLKKKFERREMFPHQPCKRKTPKLYILPETNTVSKVGKPTSEEEHKFRVFTKETTPQEIYPTIPNFGLVKDNLSRNIVAYLSDYKPFLQKTKQVKREFARKAANASNEDDSKEVKQAEVVQDQINVQPLSGS